MNETCTLSDCSVCTLSKCALCVSEQFQGALSMCALPFHICEGCHRVRSDMFAPKTLSRSAPSMCSPWSGRLLSFSVFPTSERAADLRATPIPGSPESRARSFVQESSQHVQSFSMFFPTLLTMSVWSGVSRFGLFLQTPAI